MTDTELLQQKIRDSGYRIYFIAEKLGLTYQCLQNKINNRTEFYASEIDNLCSLLGISDADRMVIFFAKAVDF